MADLQKYVNWDGLVYYDSKVKQFIKEDINTALEVKADKTTVEALSSRVTTNETNITNINSQLAGLTGAMHFVGTSTTDPTEGATISGVDAFALGDVCLYGNKEYVFNGTSWIELGDEGSYLTKTEASSTYITATQAASDIASAKSEAITEAGNAADTKIANALTNYTTTADITTALDKKADKTTVKGLDTRIEALESVGAEVNKIDAIKVNGVALTIEDKTVNIPIATTATFGVVLSSVAENKVAVAVDGSMEVNNINVNKLVQSDDDALILDCGNA